MTPRGWEWCVDWRGVVGRPERAWDLRNHLHHKSRPTDGADRIRERFIALCGHRTYDLGPQTTYDNCPDCTRLGRWLVWAERRAEAMTA